jgi:ABC-type thiamine transport system substrate-binding protein
LFPLFAVLNGYVSASFYKFFKGTNWIVLSFASSTGLFAFYTGCLTVIEACEFIETDKFIITELAAILQFGLVTNIPLSLVGTFLGFS